MFPAINATVALIGDLRVRAGLALEFDLAGLGNVDFKLLVEHDAAILEVVAGPELTGSKRVHDGADKLVLEHVARPQRRHADVFLVIVAVHRAFGYRDVLDRRLLRGNDSSVGLDNADVHHLKLVAESTIANLQLPQCLHTAFAIDLDAGIDLLASSAVVLETKGIAVILNDEGFLRIVSGRGNGLLGDSGMPRLTRMRLLGPQRDSQKTENDG